MKHYILYMLLVGSISNAQLYLTFVSGNPGKISEVKTILHGITVNTTDIDLPEVQSVDPKEVITEKLQEAFAKGATGPLMVEDTSLIFDGLRAKKGEGGLPGPLIKWFGKTELGWELLPKLAHAIGEDGAIAVSYIGYASTPDNITFFKGEVPGRIVPSRGTLGFGWDSIFQPDGSDKTFGQMDSEEKNEMSMRKSALKKLHEYLLTH